MHACIIIPGETIVVGTKSIPWDTPGRDRILDAITAGDYEEAQRLMDPAVAITAYADGRIAITGSTLTLDGQPINGLLVSRIIAMAQANLPIGPLLAFLERVTQNPAYHARVGETHPLIDRLYGFIEFGQLPLTDEGHFLARKVVQDDFYSKATGPRGKIRWAPGDTPEEPRAEVDDNPERTCSRGLHVYSAEYSKFFYSHGNKYVVVDIDPVDVVAIPSDYNNTKMRVCKGHVLAELTEEDDPEFFASLVYQPELDDETFDDDSDDDDWCDEDPDDDDGEPIDWTDTRCAHCTAPVTFSPALYCGACGHAMGSTTSCTTCGWDEGRLNIGYCQACGRDNTED